VVPYPFELLVPDPDLRYKNCIPIKVLNMLFLIFQGALVFFLEAIINFLTVN
jgi:hypothetical protein